MKKKQVLFLFLAGCLLLASCKNENNNLSSDSPATTEQITETHTENSSDSSMKEPVKITYEEFESTDMSDNGLAEIFSYYIYYPIVEIEGNTAAEDLINEDLQKRIASFEKQRDEKLEQANDMYEMSDKDIYFAPSTDSYYFSDVKTNEGILSFEVQNSTYDHGAHGMTVYECYNYDTKTGKLLTLDDIFDNRKDSMAQIKEHILFLASLPYYQDLLYPNCEDSIDDILIETCWCLAADGLHFISNPYILAPYAAGRIDFIIPYEKIPGLKAEYKPNSFLLHSSFVGEPITCDLDGDTIADTITYDIINPFATYGIAEDGAMEPTFSLEINGTSFSEDLINMEIYLSDNFCNHYYVVDLDTNDTYKELMIVDYNYSDNHLSHFFRYENSSLTYLGAVPDAPQDKSFYINGDGTIKCSMPLLLLQTYSVDTAYELKAGVLSPVQTDWYETSETDFNEEFNGHNILQDVVVYTEPSLDSKTLTLTPLDGPVLFPATDNEHWYQIKTKNQQVYYLYMTDFSTVPNQGTDMNAWDIFENLFMVG